MSFGYYVNKLGPLDSSTPAKIEGIVWHFNKFELLYKISKPPIPI